MKWYRAVWVSVIVVAGLAGLAADAGAQEVGVVFGRFLGDEVPVDLPLGGAPQVLPFAEAPLYGARFSIGLLLIDAEASVVRASSRLEFSDTVGLDAGFLYAEAAAVLKILPGPIQPFVTAGVGLHRISWEGELSDYTTLGYVAGAGVKVALGGIVVRADFRDHVTPLKLAEIDPGLVDFLGLSGDRTLHNFELSATLGFRF